MEVARSKPAASQVEWSMEPLPVRGSAQSNLPKSVAPANGPGSPADLPSSFPSRFRAPSGDEDGQLPVARKQRKLAAIPAGDFVGYSRLKGRKENVGLEG